MSVRGGCIEDLDWGQAKHIWCKRAMVPIPEGVETSEEGPVNSDYDCRMAGSGGFEEKVGIDPIGG